MRPAVDLDRQLPFGDREVRVHAGRDLVLAVVVPPLLRPEFLEQSGHLALRARRLLAAVTGEQVARELPPVPLGRRLVAVPARFAQALRAAVTLREALVIGVSELFPPQRPPRRPLLLGRRQRLP